MSQIGHHNIDEWIFNSLEGNLNMAEQRALQDFLIEHPDYLEDYMAWENSFVNRSDVPFPAMEELLAGKAFYEKGVFKWGMGVLTGIVLSFGSLALVDWYNGPDPVAEQIATEQLAQANPTSSSNSRAQAVLIPAGDKKAHQRYRYDSETNTTNPNDFSTARPLLASTNNEAAASGSGFTAGLHNARVSIFSNTRSAQSSASFVGGGSDPRSTASARAAFASRMGSSNAAFDQASNPNGLLAQGTNDLNRDRYDAENDFDTDYSYDRAARNSGSSDFGKRSRETRQGEGPVRARNAWVAEPEDARDDQPDQKAPFKSKYEPGWLEMAWLKGTSLTGKQRHLNYPRKHLANSNRIKELVNPLSRRVGYMEPVLYGPNNHALYRNPAFAGAVRQSRLLLNARDQWRDVSRYRNQTYLASYDNYIDALRGGMGVSVMRDESSDQQFRTDEVRLYYSPKIELGSGISIEPGVALSYYQRHLQENEPDGAVSISDARTGLQIAPSAQIADPKQSNLNASGGLLVQGKRFYVSFASDNLAEPTELYSTNLEYQLDRTYQADAGVVLHAAHWLDVIPGIHYYRPNNRSTVGLSTTLATGNIQLGGAILDGDGYQLMMAYNSRLIQVSYRYDQGAYPVLGTTVPEGARSHEIGLRFFFDELRKKNVVETYTGGLGKK